MSDKQRAWGFALVFLLGISSARAAGISGAQRTFVSTSGSDSSACTRSAPCRNFNAAISATSPGGEVVVLDSGGYGAVAIDRSVSLIAPPGVYAGVTGFAGTAITVAPAASGNVNLRGLNLNSQGGDIGIDFASGEVLHVENCVINGFPLGGVSYNRSTSGATSDLSVIDTTIRNGGIATLMGGAIRLNAPGGQVNALVDGCHLDRYYVGLSVGEGGRVMFRNSTAAHNYFGVAGQGGGAVVTIESSTIAFNDSDGVLAGLDGCATSGDFVIISRSMISRNVRYGIWGQCGGIFYLSYVAFSGNGGGASHLETNGTICTAGNNSLLWNQAFSDWSTACHVPEQ